MANSAAQSAPAIPSAWTKGPPSSCRTAAPSSSCSLFPPINLASRQPGLKEGCPAISFTSSEVQEGRQRLQHSLVAKFSGGRPKIDVIRRIFLEAWALVGVASIGAWDARHILIVLRSEEDAKRVLAHPLRKIDQYFFRIFRWSPEFHARRESTVVTTWVRLPALPPELFDQGYIKPIISLFGNFIAIDENTRQLVNPCFARACVEIDVSKPIPAKVWVGMGGHGYWQFLEFESNLSYCSRCRVHGHQISGCRKVKAPGGATSDQVLEGRKVQANPEPTSSSPPTREVAAPSNIQISKDVNLPPSNSAGVSVSKQFEDGSVDQGVWQVPNKKKFAKKAFSKDKVYRVKSTPMAITVPMEEACLEDAPANLDLISFQGQPDLVSNLLAPTSVSLPDPALSSDSVVVVEALASKVATDVSPSLIEVPPAPDKIPLLSPSVGNRAASPSSSSDSDGIGGYARVDDPPKAPSIPCIEPSSLTMAAVVRKDASVNDPGLPSAGPSVLVIPLIKDLDDPPLDIENSNVSDASANSAGIPLEQPAAKAAAHAKSESSGDSGPKSMSSAQRKLKFQAERKAEKAARKAERKAKNKRDATFVFEG